MSGSAETEVAEGIQERLDASRERLIAALDVWQETVDPCAKGHVEHDAAAHLGRRRVHTFAGPFGADWDYEEAVAYIRSAIRVARVGNPRMGHGGAARSAEGRWVTFATKEPKP